MCIYIIYTGSFSLPYFRNERAIEKSSDQNLKICFAYVLDFSPLVCFVLIFFRFFKCSNRRVYVCIN